MRAIPRSILLSCCLVPACGPSESTLAQAHDSGEEGKPAQGQPKADPPANDSAKPVPTPKETEPENVDVGDQPSSVPLDPDGIPIPSLGDPVTMVSPGDSANAAELRFGLAEGARYRITTIGMLFLPLIEKPTGFAREEDLVLDDCKGEGAQRNCLLTHTFRHFEAEPPAGSGLEADERSVAGVTTKHRLDASGLRTTETEIAGTAEALAHPAAVALAQANEFFCLRLPNQSVGVGATWKDVCRRRQSGMIVTRDVTWKLVSLEDGEGGKRAELQFAGNTWAKDDKGIRKGRVQGVLYFWVDAGEPHLLRERIDVAIDAEKGIRSKTDLRYQWTKVDADGKTLLRTDGKPFGQAPVDLRKPVERKPEEPPPAPAK